MFEQVVFRCQFLSVLVKRRPGSPDSISDFGRLLLLESNIWPKYFVLSPLVSITTFMLSTSISFLVFRVLVAKNFRLSWMNPESHFFSTPLEFAQPFLKLFFGRRKQEHIVSKSHVCEAVMVVVTQINSHTFFSFASAECRLPVLSVEPC